MLISDQQIYLDLSLTNRDDVLKFISSEAAKQNIVSDQHKVFQGFINRENEYPTAFQEGIAIPHVKSDSVKEAKLFFVKIKEKIDWHSPDQFKVKVVFAILIPEEEAGTKHLEVLSTLATNLLEEDFQNEVFEANNKVAILELLKNMEQE